MTSSRLITSHLSSLRQSGYWPRLGRDGAFLFVGTRLAERDDLRQIAVELDGKRVAFRCQLDAIDERADDLASLDLGRGLAERFLQLLDLAAIERRQIGVDA